MEDLSVNATLSRILTRSDQYLNSRLQNARSPSTTFPIHVDLPEPPPLLPALVAAGAKQEVAQVMQAAYHKRACEFREQALATISRACSKLAQIPSTCSHTSDETIIAAFKQMYLKKLNAWISDGVAVLQERGPSVLGYRDDGKSVPPKTLKTFNHHCVPLLEHFFEENPFPSHADKVFLARKSSMTYRQIHVWFQNRRNRTKRVSRKKPVSGRARIPLQPLIRRMSRFAVPTTTESDAPPSVQSTPFSSPTEPDNVLGGVAPPHAFPTIYPPSCEYNPFPSVHSFVTLEWPRQQALSSGRARQSVVDVDSLTEQFSQLNVWDSSFSQSRRKTTFDGSAATSAITVMPSPAPHPACVRQAAVVSAPPRVIIQSIRATASSHAFRTPHPNVPMTTLVPISAHQRKIAPLPKRIPSRQPFSPDREVSESSMSTSSLVPASRSPSLGSEASAQDSRLTCDRSSSASSTITTPETPHSPLPHPT